MTSSFSSSSFSSSSSCSSSSFYSFIFEGDDDDVVDDDDFEVEVVQALIEEGFVNLKKKKSKQASKSRLLESFCRIWTGNRTSMQRTIRIDISWGEGTCYKILASWPQLACFSIFFSNGQYQRVEVGQRGHLHII